MAGIAHIPRRLTGRVVKPGGLITRPRLNSAFDGGLVVNGGFDDAFGWTYGDGWAWTDEYGGAARHTPTGGNATIQNMTTVTAGETYTFTFEIKEFNAGRVRLFFSGATGTWRSTTGVFVETLTPTADNPIQLQADAAFDGVIDNIRAVHIPTNQTTADTSYSHWLNPLSGDVEWRISVDGVVHSNVQNIPNAPKEDVIPSIIAQIVAVDGVASVVQEGDQFHATSEAGRTLSAFTLTYTHIG